MSQPDRFALFNRPMPPGYREELRELIAAPAAEEHPEERSFLLFQLGELCLALPTVVASAVAPVLHISPIPHRRNTVLLGLVAFRGEIFPCCSLARILEVAQQPVGSPRTIFLEEAAGRRWAVPVDAVHGIHIAALGEVTTGTASLAAGWLRGCFQVDASQFHLLDHEILFRQLTLATA
jgi:chemotaxis signal transduction protein